MEDFESDLNALTIKRAALDEQLKNGDGDARTLQDELREIEGQIAALESAMERGGAPHSKG